MNNMRRGFTMIELIFVIVIIGILAAVAIPRLAATRDDATVSAEYASARTVLGNLGAEYTATGTLLAANITEANAGLDCYTVAAAGTDGINLSVAAKSATRCPATVVTQLQTMSASNGLTNAGGGVKLYKFGGAGVVR